MNGPELIRYYQLSPCLIRISLALPDVLSPSQDPTLGSAVRCPEAPLGCGFLRLASTALGSTGQAETAPQSGFVSGRLELQVVDGRPRAEGPFSTRPVTGLLAADAALGRLAEGAPGRLPCWTVFRTPFRALAETKGWVSPAELTLAGLPRRLPSEGRQACISVGRRWNF